MGRGRGKGKKFSTNHDDPESGEEEKIPAQKRRGRPQKQLKDEIDEQESEKLEEEESEDAKTGFSNKEMKSSAAENGKRRKRNAQSKENLDTMMDENSNGTRSSAGESSKYNGFRSNGNRRKNKPRRAAEVGVECK